MWFKVDDKLHEHRKAHKAGKAAMGVWVLAGSWSSDNGYGGFVPERVLSRWGNKRDATALVDAGLWSTHEKDGEPGWVFHEWDERNPDEDSVKAIKDAEKDGGTLGNHRRWHVKRGIVSKDCEHCQESGTQSGEDRGGRFGGESSDPTRPVPDPSDSVVKSLTTSSPHAIDGSGLMKIALATGGDLPHADKVCRQVLSTAGGDVRSPLRYVLAAIRSNPEAHRYRRGNPTKATACPEHPGEWADHCRIHQAEARA